MLKLSALSAGLATASATTYFSETFEDGWQKRWAVGSDWKSASDMGEFSWTGGKYPGAAGDKGIQTSQDAKFYSLSAAMDKEFDNAGKDLVLSYTVKHEQDLDCGGAYIKLLPGGFDKKKFGGDTPYAIMFGPDVCGYSTRRTHVILTYKGKNLLTKKNVKVETDRVSHRYTLVLHPDNTYEVEIDGAKVESGKLEEDWDFLAPKTIKDPEAKKPADWVDEATMPDPEDKKPEGYDNIAAKIPDAEAKKPEDWDEEEDGSWEAPLIDNPEYKGEWVAKRIPNPAYKGPWVHPEIDNPEYKADDELYRVCGGEGGACGAVGFELWQVKSGTIFDDIIVTDSLEEANAFAAATFEAKKETEKKAFDAIEEEKRAKEEEARKAAEEDAKKNKKEDDDEDDEEEENKKDEL